MTLPAYSEDEYDLLKETVNVAMGEAGSGLAKLLHSFVDLSIPDIKIVPAEEMAEKIAEGNALGPAGSLTAIRQTFYGGDGVDGEAIVVFDESGPDVVSGLIGVGAAAGRPQELELLLEMANLLAGACLNGISKQLFGREMTFEAPAVLAEKMDLRSIGYRVFQRRQLRWNATLVVRIQFILQKESLKSDLMILMSEKSIETVRAAVDQLLAKL
jgi:chemotaxis protein CheC